MSALDGIVVLDLTRLLPGATATLTLVEHGAEVIKIEQPGAGDYSRTMNAAVFARTNGGKKSVAIDLKNPAGRDALLALSVAADVLIEGFRPGVMARLGLGYDVLRARNQRLIYASLTGYGQTGPYATLAGHDINYMALGGVLGLCLPAIPGVQIADLAGGAMRAVNATLLALLDRHRTGLGSRLDISMLDGVRSLLTSPLAGDTATLSGRYACYNVYRTGDGRWLALGALEPKFWQELCRRLDCEALIAWQFTDAKQAEAKARIAEILLGKTAIEWFELLSDSDCCLTPVLTPDEAAAGMAPPAEPAPHWASTRARYFYAPDFLNSIWTTLFAKEPLHERSLLPAPGQPGLSQQRGRRS